MIEVIREDFNTKSDQWIAGYVRATKLLLSVVKNALNGKESIYHVNLAISDQTDWIDEDMDIIENHYYFKILLMYKGEYSQEEMMTKARFEGELGNVAIAYAIANWNYYNNKKDEAKSLLEEIILMENWATFGYIAAEADLKRMKELNR